MKPFKVAAAQYPVDYLKSWQEYHNKLRSWVTDANDNGAQILLFPEYAAMELCSLFKPDIQQNLVEQLKSMQPLLPDYLNLHQELAAEFDVTIIGGSFPVYVEDSNSYVNRAFVFQPQQKLQFQDKQIMTRFEREDWQISTGEPLNIIQTAFGNIGICICYDSEFPLLARALIDKGADFLLVPSVTETLAGFYRVRIGSQARALENQCYVVHAPLVGPAPWSPVVDKSQGAAGVYTPVDKGFPNDGILVSGEINTSCWVYATLDLNKTRDIRKNGTTLNYKDWSLNRHLSS